MDSLPPVCDSHIYAGAWIHLSLPPLDVEAAVAAVGTKGAPPASVTGGPFFDLGFDVSLEDSFAGLYATPHLEPKSQVQPAGHRPITPRSAIASASASVRASNSWLVGNSLES